MNYQCQRLRVGPPLELPPEPSTFKACGPSNDALFWLSELRSALGDSGGSKYADSRGVAELLGVPSELNSEKPALMGRAESALALLTPLTPVTRPPAKLPVGPTLMAVALRAPGVLQTTERKSLHIESL